MRIRRIKIADWRNFENIELTVGRDVGLVCVVGANGTGKSHILELISASAHEFRLAPGVELPRGNPFHGPHTLIEVEVELPTGLFPELDVTFDDAEQFGAWDRTLLLSSVRTDAEKVLRVTAGGVPDPHAQTFARAIINRIESSKEVHHLRLDADRAYPKQNVSAHELGGAYDTDWVASEFTRDRAFRPTNTLYSEWLKYLLSIENQAGAKLMQATRRAREEGRADPVFTDHFDSYKNSLKEVLPHVVFSGIDMGKKVAVFDTSGTELTFDQLSGGEREIGFMVGQIDRFHLRRGLFLLDEPELHLNSDLIRTWVRYLNGTVTTGQVWIATHSLEAVEAAGAENSILLERDHNTKKVISATPLSSRPIISALARTIGSPAFAISQLTFVFVEGEPGLGERERYRRIVGTDQDIRITECGGCTEVERRVKALKDLAGEAAQPLKLHGIVDRDWRSPAEITRLQQDGIFVLPVHEIENLFLHPGTLAQILKQNGSPLAAQDILRNASDQRAGMWVYEHAVAQSQLEPHRRSLGPLIKAAVYRLTWVDFADIPRAIASSLAAVPVTDTPQVVKDAVEPVLVAAATAYSRIRTGSDPWKRCEGKEVFKTVSSRLGFSSASVAEKAIAQCWADNPRLVPAEVQQLRTFVTTGRP